MTKSLQKFPCPCCGYLTLESPPPGTYLVCPVCNWEDDPVQFKDPQYSGGANVISLQEAKENFKNLYAISEDARSLVRPPRPDEMS